MTRLGAGSHSCGFVNNIMDVCLFLCPLVIFRLVRHVCLPLSVFVCVCARVHVLVCVYIHSRGAGVVILKQFISAHFSIVHALLNTKTFTSVNVYFMRH